MMTDSGQTVLLRTKDLVTKHLNGFSLVFDAYFNDLDKIVVCSRGLDTLYSQINPNSTKPPESEERSLKFALIYLSCPIFEKKFAAVSYLNTRVDAYKAGSEKDREKYREVLLRGRVLNILYITGYHPEIARKSDELLAFLAPKLQVTDIKTLLISAFEQSPEKGGVISYCLRKSFQVLEIELIRSILDIFTNDFPIEKIERETILLIIEIIKQSGEKSSKFLMFGKGKEGPKIVEDSIQLLWSCLDAKKNVGCSHPAEHHLDQDGLGGAGGKRLEVERWQATDGRAVHHEAQREALHDPVHRAAQVAPRLARRQRLALRLI